MRTLFLICSSFLFFQNVNSQTPSNDPTWILQWEDQFDTYDNNKWVKANYCDHENFVDGIQELGLYMANNVTTTNGNLVLTMNKTNISCPSSPPSPTTWACGSCNANRLYKYTTGWVETKYPYNVQYGYVESRQKLPFVNGLWHSFWTWRGDGVPTSNEAEIDVFEMLAGGEAHSPNIITTNLHISYPDSKLEVEKPAGFDYRDWHVYGVEWSPTKIIWYVDGIITRISTNPNIIDPVRIIFATAVSAEYPPDETSVFPAQVLIDYVKVYKLNNDCTTNLNVCNYNFGTHDNKVKKNITIGNGSCINSLSVGQNVFMRASEGILINGDFTVPVGAELYLDVNTCY